MSKKQSLDKLFQEKFQDVEITPDSSVWNAIEAKLKLKKSAPTFNSNWLKYSGIAALFILSSLTGLYKSNSIVSSKRIISVKSSSAGSNKFNQIVGIQQDSESGRDSNKFGSAANALKKNIIAATSTPFKTDNKEKVAVIKSNLFVHTKSNNIIVKSGVLNCYNKKLISLHNISKFNKGEVILNKAKNAIVVTLENQNTNDNFQNESKPNSATNHDIKTKINITTRLEINQIKSNLASNTTELELANANAEKNSIDKQLATERNSVQNKRSLARNETEYKTVNNLPNYNTNSLQPTTTKITIIIDSLGYNKNLDSTKLATVEVKTLERLLNEKELKKSEQKVNRWQLMSNVAPIYFGSISNGSPLDKKFAENDKSFLVSQSYGVGINYAVSSKVKIRVGINLLSLDYDTKNIAYSMNNNGAKLTNLSSNSAGKTMSIDNIKNVTVYGKSSNTAQTEVITSYVGALNQKMGYIEVPLEISYKLGNTQFNIDLITGLSTFYLQQNSVFLRTGNENIKIGEASNLNPFHFSGNIGLGLNYKIIKDFSASIEPTFKYQVNTFSNDAGNFRPYVFGIYSGVKYSF